MQPRKPPPPPLVLTHDRHHQKYKRGYQWPRKNTYVFHKFCFKKHHDTGGILMKVVFFSFFAEPISYGNNSNISVIPTQRFDPIPEFNDNIPFLPSANEVWGKVIFSEACVKNSVHGGSTWAGTLPRTRYTPQNRYTLPGPGTPPRPGTPFQDQVHPPKHVIATPSGAVHAGRYGQQAGGMHPTGMHSCHKYWMFLCIKFVT